MSSSLTDLLSAALSARAELIAGLHAEQTDAYRVFHGTAEGAPGLTIDRYGAVLLAFFALGIVFLAKSRKAG